MKVVELKCVQEYYASGQIRSEIFYLNGYRHNENGPALRGWLENGQLRWEEAFYLNGKQLTAEEFANRNTCSGKIVEIDGKKYKLVPAN